MRFQNMKVSKMFKRMRFPRIFKRGMKSRIKKNVKMASSEDQDIQIVFPTLDKAEDNIGTDSSSSDDDDVPAQSDPADSDPCMKISDDHNFPADSDPADSDPCMDYPEVEKYSPIDLERAIFASINSSNTDTTDDIESQLALSESFETTSTHATSTTNSTIPSGIIFLPPVKSFDTIDENEPNVCVSEINDIQKTNSKVANSSTSHSGRDIMTSAKSAFKKTEIQQKLSVSGSFGAISTNSITNSVSNMQTGQDILTPAKSSDAANGHEAKVCDFVSNGMKRTHCSVARSSTSVPEHNILTSTKSYDTANEAAKMAYTSRILGTKSRELDQDRHEEDSLRPCLSYPTYLFEDTITKAASKDWTNLEQKYSFETESKVCDSVTNDTKRTHCRVASSITSVPEHNILTSTKSYDTANEAAKMSSTSRILGTKSRALDQDWHEEDSLRLCLSYPTHLFKDTITKAASKDRTNLEQKYSFETMLANDRNVAARNKDFDNEGIKEIPIIVAEQSSKIDSDETLRVDHSEGEIQLHEQLQKSMTSNNELIGPNINAKTHNIEEDETNSDDNEQTERKLEEEIQSPSKTIDKDLVSPDSSSKAIHTNNICHMNDIKQNKYDDSEDVEMNLHERPQSPNRDIVYGLVGPDRTSVRRRTNLIEERGDEHKESAKTLQEDSKSPRNIVDNEHNKDEHIEKATEQQKQIAASKPVGTCSDDFQEKQNNLRGADGVEESSVFTSSTNSLTDGDFNISSNTVRSPMPEKSTIWSNSIADTLTAKSNAYFVSMTNAVTQNKIADALPTKSNAYFVSMTKAVTQSIVADALPTKSNAYVVSMTNAVTQNISQIQQRSTEMINYIGNVAKQEPIFSVPFIKSHRRNTNGDSYVTATNKPTEILHFENKIEVLHPSQAYIL